MKNNRNWFTFFKNGRLNLDDERISLDYQKQSRWSLIFLMFGSLFAYAVLMFSNYAWTFESDIVLGVALISVFGEMIAMRMENKKDERLEKMAYSVRYFVNRFILLGLIINTLFSPQVPLVYVTFWIGFVMLIDHFWHAVTTGVYYEELVDKKDSIILFRVAIYVLGFLGFSFLLTWLYRPMLVNEVTLWELIVPIGIVVLYELTLIGFTYLKIRKNRDQ